MPPHRPHYLRYFHHLPPGPASQAIFLTFLKKDFSPLFQPSCCFGAVIYQQIVTIIIGALLSVSIKAMPSPHFKFSDAMRTPVRNDMPTETGRDSLLRHAALPLRLLPAKSRATSRLCLCRSISSGYHIAALTATTLQAIDMARMSSTRASIFRCRFDDWWYSPRRRLAAPIATITITSKRRIFPSASGSFSPHGMRVGRHRHTKAQLASANLSYLKHCRCVYTSTANLFRQAWRLIWFLISLPYCIDDIYFAMILICARRASLRNATSKILKYMLFRFFLSCLYHAPRLCYNNMKARFLDVKHSLV